MLLNGWQHAPLVWITVYQVRLLMLKSSENPPIYLPADLDWSASSMPWRVAYTKPRQEKSLARDLLQRNVAYFLPMLQKETTSGGRRRHGLYPLFKSYLFFRGDEDARLAVLKTERTVKIIDPVAYGLICVQGYGKIGKFAISAPTMIRFGQMTEDEFFVTAQAASDGVTITNSSSTEPLVILKHFNPGNPEMPQR